MQLMALRLLRYHYGPGSLSIAKMAALDTSSALLTLVRFELAVGDY